MPTRKQRRRRQKSLRHESEYVLVVVEGNEVEAAPEDVKPRKESKAPAGEARARTPAKGRAAARTGRVIQPPSWRRVGRRGLIFAPLMFVAVSLLDHSQPLAFYAVQTVFLLALFLPFSYAMDAMAYRMYLKRTGSPPAAPKASTREAKRQSARRSPR